MILGKIIYNIKHENFIDVSLIDKLFNMFEDLINLKQTKLNEYKIYNYIFSILN